MNGRWLPIPGYEGLYDVSDRGQVRNARTGRVLTGHVTRRGYRVVCLSRGDRYRPCKVGPLVLRAFVGPPAPDQECCHGPGGSLDDRWPENLRWDTRAENLRDLVRHGTHRQTRKTHGDCGHLLRAPNLVPASRGRDCLACNRTRSIFTMRRRRGLPAPDISFADLADQKYAEIMGKAAA